MNNKEFEAIIEARIEKTKELILNKGAEYADDDNRLHNFETASRIAGGSAAMALDGMLMKHYVSYRDLLTKIELGEEISKELVEEKLGDIITYFHLQEAIMYDYIKSRDEE